MSNSTPNNNLREFVCHIRFYYDVTPKTIHHIHREFFAETMSEAKEEARRSYPNVQSVIAEEITE